MDLGIDFQTLGIGLAGISIAIIAIMMLGSALWPDQSQRYKKLINDVIIGAILLLVGSTLVGFLMGG